VGGTSVAPPSRAQVTFEDMTAFENQPTPGTADGQDVAGDAPAPDATTGAASATDAPPGSTAELQRQYEEQRDRHLRLAADFENARRRWSKQLDEARTNAQGDLVKHLLDALDDIGRFAHVDPATTDSATIVQGVEMVERKLMKLLTGAGLEVVNPVGQQFDPALHEAVGTEPTPAREDDHVVSRVYQVGYRFGSQLLRPARVVVKQYQG
jgi:molecular chaperone GrpE